MHLSLAIVQPRLLSWCNLGRPLFFRRLAVYPVVGLPWRWASHAFYLWCFRQRFRLGSLILDTCDLLLEGQHERVLRISDLIRHGQVFGILTLLFFVYLFINLYRDFLPTSLTAAPVLNGDY